MVTFLASHLLLGYETRGQHGMNQHEFNFEASCLHHLKAMNSNELVWALPQSYLESCGACTHNHRFWWLMVVVYFV